jgi:DNA repair exonuclease SbcCD ATPase subunit
MHLQVAADGAARAQAETAVQRQEAMASLEVARAELDKVQQQLALAQSAADKKGQEVRELNHMLKAWEAMRLGKDAQVRRGAAGGLALAVCSRASETCRGCGCCCGLNGAGQGLA